MQSLIFSKKLGVSLEALLMKKYLSKKTYNAKIPKRKMAIIIVFPIIPPLKSTSQSENTCFSVTLLLMIVVVACKNIMKNVKFEFLNDKFSEKL